MNRGFLRHRDLFATYLRPQRGRVALLAALLLGGIALQLLNPQVLRVFIDAVQQPEAGIQTQTALLAAAFIGIGLTQRAAAFAALYLSERIGWSATNALRADLTRHCLRLDMAFHKQHTPGELIERVDGDITLLSNFFSQFWLQLLGNGVLILGVLALLLREDWRIGAGLAAYTAVTLIALSAVQNLGVRRWDEYREAQAGQFGFLEERMAGTEDIRASGAEAYTVDRLSAIMQVVMRKHRVARLISNLTFAVTHFLSVAGYALGLAIGAYVYTQGQASIGTAFLIVAYVGMLSAPLDGIRAQFQDLQQASAGIGRIGTLLHLRPRVLEAPNALLPDGPLAVEFEHVSFRYDDDEETEDRGLKLEDSTGPSLRPPPLSSDKLVLENITFSLAPGQVLGLLGR
ncbi:MAG TPA: ABC transporter ATP-binding protein, partial [Roseiflexaceae bacterium]|nr:ABC transporter ATP-binding protein [Roseiflexaceae bacterium]